MLITFSFDSAPALHLTKPLEAAHAIEPTVCAEQTWKRPNQVRLTLRLLGSRQPASSNAHEAFIAAVFRQDPRATVKTARALYKGAADYRRQRG